jgi:hypothetical protein
VRPPDDVDRLARALATASLVSDWSEAKLALARLDALEARRRAQGERPSGLLPFAHDAVNATADDPVVYRAASARLLERGDLDPAHRTQLEQVVADDPMRLADQRIRDDLIQTFGSAFNALIAPIAKSVTRGAMETLGLVRALLGIVVREHLDDALSLFERQALVHWKRHLAEDPDASDAAEVRDQIDEAEGRLDRTHHDRMLRAARRARDHGRYAAAQLLADRALTFSPEDPDALELRAEAQRQRMAANAEQARSLEATALPNVAPLEARPLLIALLLPDGDVSGAAGALLREAPDGPLRDEAHFAEALALGERGDEVQMWSRLEEIADAGGRSNAARHARALLDDPAQNPYGAFDDARAADRLDQASWILLGPLARGPRDLDLPGPAEWALEAPSVLRSLTSLPNRLLSYPWLTPWPFGRKPAWHARHYLSRHPDGAYTADVRDWLRGYEARRGNFLAALRGATSAPATDPADLAELSQRAAEQTLAAVKHETRPDYRSALLRQLVMDFPETRAGREAGQLARLTAKEATPQRIRLSRNFLIENPSLVGNEGLGLTPGLLDDDPSNGELHAEGVSFVGGRTLEFAFLGASGKDDDPPILRRERVSDQRLAQTVATLDEITRRNALLDAEDVVKPDAAREFFFERARLGVADRPDRRAGARSSYTYLSMRERYGLVRARESILPVDLVIQGSLSELGLGAFPRIRMPRPTPDAFLYE